MVKGKFALLSKGLIGQHVIEPLNQFMQGTETLSANNLKIIISASNVIAINDLHQTIDSLLAGQALILIAGAKSIFAVSFPGVPRRAIEEAPTEKSIKGPKEGFTETITDNIGLIRRYLKDPNLRLEKKLIGERTKTEIAVMYLNDVANPDIVKEVHKRLEQIKIDGILESGYIAELISDRRLTLFPLVQETERPDKVVAAILEGRVAIMVDRSPFNIIVSVTPNEFYQSQEDFYFNWLVATMLRLIRGLGTIIAVTLPGFYLAMVSVNPELLPPTVVQIEASSGSRCPSPLCWKC
jgi:spore germination protein KA